MVQSQVHGIHKFRRNFCFGVLEHMPFDDIVRDLHTYLVVGMLVR